MALRLLLFGRLADLAGWREQGLDGAFATARQVMSYLADQDPALGEALAQPAVRAVLDKAFIGLDEPLPPRGELAFLPPMSGG